ATATFTDSISSTATATSTATVTGHTCDVAIVKTASPTDVCNGKNTPVTYSYLVTNKSDFFNATIVVTDDKNGNVGTTAPWAPGASQTLTATQSITGTVTNIGPATATFTDSVSSTATATSTATVTGHTCDVSIVKTASPTTVCTGQNTQVTYTYVVKN